MIQLLAKTLDFVLLVLGMIFLGLFLAGFMMEMGIVTRVSRFARPLVEVAHLPKANASAFNRIPWLDCSCKWNCYRIQEGVPQLQSILAPFFADD